MPPIRVFVTELTGYRCRHCVGKVGTGVKEEPGSWKVYSVCLSENNGCGTEKIGTISRSSVSHTDEMNERAEELVKAAAIEK